MSIEIIEGILKPGHKKEVEQIDINGMRFLSS